MRGNFIVTLPDGAQQDIRFWADLGAFDIDYQVAGESIDGIGGGYALVPLTRWRLDLAGAALLGIPARGVGEWVMFLDHHCCDEDPDNRELRTYDLIEATAIPEPSIALLLLAGLLLRKWRAA